MEVYGSSERPFIRVSRSREFADAFSRILPEDLPHLLSLRPGWPAGGPEREMATRRIPCYGTSP